MTRHTCTGDDGTCHHCSYLIGLAEDAYEPGGREADWEADREFYDRDRWS